MFRHPIYRDEDGLPAMAGAFDIAPDIPVEVEPQGEEAPLTYSQRSVLMGLAMQASRHRRPLQRSAVFVGRQRAGIAYAYERRLLGCRTGIYDAVVLLGPAPAMGAIEPIMATLDALAPAADVTTLRIIGGDFPAAPPQQPPHAEARPNPGVRSYELREVLPLGGTYDDFLRKLGKHTRRNINLCRRKATANGMIFRCRPSPLELADAAFFRLARNNMPVPLKPRRLRGLSAFVATRPRQFHAAIAFAAGGCVSLASGFIESDMAFMVYQINDREHSPLYPSLLMRSLLAEWLIDHGVRHLAFLGGCVGLLAGQCLVARAQELVLVRQSFAGRVKSRLWTRTVTPGRRGLGVAPSLMPAGQ